jgi:hypothetical protein
MKKYTENIESLQESAAYTAVDKMLKNEIQDLYRQQVVRPAFSPGGVKTGDPTAIQVLEGMKRIIDKYTTEDSHGRLVLKSPLEIKSEDSTSKW